MPAPHRPSGVFFHVQELAETTPARLCHPLFTVTLSAMSRVRAPPAQHAMFQGSPHINRLLI